MLASACAVRQNPIQARSATTPVHVEAQLVFVKQSGTPDPFLTLSGNKFMVLSKGQVDERIAAGEKEGTLKILTYGSLPAQNNVGTDFNLGFIFPLQVDTPPNTGVVAFASVISRSHVTPQITASNAIKLSVQLEQTAPDFGPYRRNRYILPFDRDSWTTHRLEVVTQWTEASAVVPEGGVLVIQGIDADPEVLLLLRPRLG
jgi:type II secretory pathway component HofQ